MTSQSNTASRIQHVPVSLQARHTSEVARCTRAASTLASELVNAGRREAVIQVLGEAADAHAASATTIQAWLSAFPDR
jgi:hypothetical protein